METWIFFFKFIFGCAGYLHCCLGLSLVPVSGGYCLVGELGLLIAVASLAAEHRLSGTWASAARLPDSGTQAQQSWLVGLSCCVAGRIFPDQGSNLHLLHWHADALSQSHQTSPASPLLITHRLGKPDGGPDPHGQ